MYPFKKIFSLAVKSMSNPEPSSIKGDIFPWTSILPSVCFIIPEITFNNVLLPAPLYPTIPSISPSFNSKLIFFNAHIFSKFKSRFRNFIRYSFKEYIFSLFKLKHIDKLSNFIIVFFIISLPI